MDDQTTFGETPNPQGATYARLAQWIQQIMQSPESMTLPSSTSLLPASHTQEVQSEQLFLHDYHLRFYRQLPDFIMALLNEDPQAVLHFAPLLYHLAGCPECHYAYLDLYDAMRAAVQPHEPRPLLGQGTRTLNAMPQYMLEHLCVSAISQAEALVRLGRREQTDSTEAARTLLRLALQIGAHITQRAVYNRALHDLVRVAAFASGQELVREDEPNAHAYTPTLAGAGGVRGKKTVRSVDMKTQQSSQAAQAVIVLQSHKLEGRVIQQGDVLELHLRDLEESLRGHHVRVSILLGSLLEPVRWHGGNPHAILSPSPVDASGAVVIPLGETELRLTNSEEYHLLATTFMLLEIRKLA